MVARYGDECPFKATVLVCAGYEFHSSIKYMEKNLFGLYNFALGYCMRRKLLEHREVFEPLLKSWGLNFDKEVDKIKGIRDFDRLITSKVQGYGVPDNYYRLGSLGQRLKDIKIPTLLLSPTDDPVFEYYPS